MLDGGPDVWIDGHLHRLRPGDAVAFPAGTGICHTFLNDTDTDTDTDVRLLIMGETPKPENRVRSPRHEALEAGRHDRWTDWPAPPLGPRDGRPRVKP